MPGDDFKNDATLTIAPSAHTVAVQGTSLQAPHAAAVVIPTILRPSLGRALQSVYRQDLKGRIHILIGIDKSPHAREALLPILQQQPAHCTTTLFDLPYSTSVRHGGLHPAEDGGVLRTVLSYLANSRYVAYLDDDNWWAPDHLSSLLTAIRGHDWAHGLRWYVDPDTDQPICIDRWESIGVGRGAYNKALGGWVDPNCLMLDKLACESVLRLWSIPLAQSDKGMTADRNVFHHLKNGYSSACTYRPSCFYTINPQDGAHSHRLKWIAQDRAERGQPPAPSTIS